MIKIKSFLRKVFLSKPFFGLLFGILTVGALPPYDCLFCLFIGFTGLTYLLDRVETKKQAAWLGYAFGFGFFAMGLSWVSNALMIEGMGFEALAPFPPFGFGLWGGFFVLAPCIIAFKAPKGWRRLAAFSASWVIFEWVRSWLFTGFPWNLIGSVWTNYTPMIQTASWWGVYGLSLVTVFMATLPVFCTKPEKGRVLKALSPLFVVTVMALGMYGYGALRLKNAPAVTDTVRGVKIRLVQANVPQGQKWSEDEAEQILMKHVHLSRSEGAEKITHVVWPETATQFRLAQDKFALGMTTSALLQDAILIAGSLRTEPAQGYPPFRMYNSIVAINDIGVFLGSYDKSHLVPFGEYAPLVSIFPFMRKVTPGGIDFSEGLGVKTTVIPRTLPVGMLVCYEVIFPGQVAEKEYRPYWLLNVTNDGWYGISAGPYQHFATAQMRAVEEGLPLARAANTGISGMIDAYGRVAASLPLGQEGVLDVGLPRRTSKPTFYASYGNAIPLGLATILLIISFGRIKRKAEK